MLAIVSIQTSPQRAYRKLGEGLVARRNPFVLADAQQGGDGHLEKVGSTAVYGEALHAAHHVDAGEHRAAVGDAVEHAQSLLVDVEGAREPRHGSGGALVRLPFDQTDDDRKLYCALASVRVGDDSREFVERYDVEFLSAKLVAVKPRNAFEHLRFGFTEVVVAAGNIAQGAEH